MNSKNEKKYFIFVLNLTCNGQMTHRPWPLFENYKKQHVMLRMCVQVRGIFQKYAHNKGTS